ncbi:MAG TPA: hypothetical protein VGK49_05340 [Ilumatobacteraceae bacterium]
MNAARVLDWHEAGAWVLIVVNAVAGVWALAAYRLTALRGRPLWVTIVAGQAMAFVQAILGVILISRYDYEADDLHALYGFSAIVAVGILYSYRTSSFMKGKELLLYGFGSLFIMGLGLRNLVL